MNTFEMPKDGVSQEASLRLSRNPALILYIAGFASLFALGGKEMIDSGVDLLGLNANAAGGIIEDASNVPAWILGVVGGAGGALAWTAVIMTLIVWRYGHRRGRRVAERFF